MVHLNSLNDLNSATIVWVHCVSNCGISNLRRKKKSEAKICFKDKKGFFPSFRGDHQKPRNLRFIQLGKAEANNCIHSFNSTETHTVAKNSYHKLDFQSPGILLSCNGQYCHAPSPKPPFHLAATITSRTLFLNFWSGWKLLTSSINFTHNYYKTSIKFACANIILFPW